MRTDRRLSTPDHFYHARECLIVPKTGDYLPADHEYFQISPDPFQFSMYVDPTWEKQELTTMIETIKQISMHVIIRWFIFILQSYLLVIQ